MGTGGFGGHLTSSSPPQSPAAERDRWPSPREADGGVGREHQRAVSPMYPGVGGDTPVLRSPSLTPNPLCHVTAPPPCRSLFGNIQEEVVQDTESVRLQQQAHRQQHSCTLDECFQLYTKEEQVPSTPPAPWAAGTLPALCPHPARTRQSRCRGQALPTAQQLLAFAVLGVALEVAGGC